LRLFVRRALVPGHFDPGGPSPARESLLPLGWDDGRSLRLVSAELSVRLLPPWPACGPALDQEEAVITTHWESGPTLRADTVRLLRRDGLWVFFTPGDAKLFHDLPYPELSMSLCHSAGLPPCAAIDMADDLSDEGFMLALRVMSS